MKTRKTKNLQKTYYCPVSKAKRGPYGNHRVNPHEPNEIKYWCQKFNCTSMQLTHAVRAVGTSAEAVREFLKGKK